MRETDMMINITLASPADVQAIASLLRDVEQFYGAGEFEDLAESVANVAAALFGPTHVASALLAWDGKELVGMAAYSFLWPAAGSSRSLFLKELYVRGEQRGRGIGRRLMAELAYAAQQAGCDRVEWQTDIGNHDAQRFYARLGAMPHAGKVFYRTNASDFAAMLADRQKPVG